MTLDEALDQTPLIAIIRGVTPDEVAEIGDALICGGIRVIEVPLNSPDPFKSIERLAQRCSAEAIVGAGTVLDADDVQRVADAGGQIIVTPNTDATVIRRAVDLGLPPFPGFYTPSEAHVAIKAGATRLKLFPAATGGPQHLRAIKAVLPPNVKVYAVGGARPAEFAQWREAGAVGLGLGSELYRPGQSAKETYERARRAVAACAAA